MATLSRLASAVLVACVATSLASSAAQPSAAAAASFVQELTEEGFTEATTAELPILVEFYAPWCGQCKTFKPEVERAAQLAVERNLGFTVGRLDAQKYLDTAADHDIKNVPTFVLFRNGQAIQFPALHTAEAMLAGADKLLGLEQQISPIKNFDGPPNDFAMWLFWRGASDKTFHTTTVLYEPAGLEGQVAEDARALREAFDAAAVDLLRFSNLRFVSVSNTETMADFELPTDRATLVVYKDHDEGRTIYEGPSAAGDIMRFVLTQDVPMVSTNVWHRNLQGARKRVGSLGLFFVTGKQYEDGQSLARVKGALQGIVADMERTGAITRGDFTLAVVDGTKYASWLRAYDQPADKLPAIVMENTTSGELFAGPDMVEAGAANPSAEYLAALAAWQAREAEEQEEGTVHRDDGLEHKIKEIPLTWVNVPVEQVTAFLNGYASGALTPIKTLSEKDRAGYRATPTPLAPAPTPEPQDDAAGEHEEL